MEHRPGVSELDPSEYVSSISVVGEPELSGDVTFSEGSNITLTQVGNNIEITSASGLPVSIIDTKADILASTATAGLIAWATDFDQLLVANGTNWYIESSYVDKDLQAPDRGWTQNSNRRGLATDYITDKQIANAYFGNSTRTDAGGWRYNPTTAKMQAYLSGAWREAVTGFTFSESWAMLQTVPNGYLLTYNVFSGNSTVLGINGRPLVQGYRASRGCYPPQQTLSGGTF